MPTVSSVALGGLQVVALLLPVVIATTRFLVPELEPDERHNKRRKRKLEWLQDWMVFAGLAAIAFLCVCAIMLVWAVVTAYSMPPVLFLGFILLLTAILVFAYPIILIVNDQRNRGNLPSLEPPR